MSEVNPALERRRRRSVFWVVALSTAALVFDGYDLVVYGTVVPTLLGDPTQLGELTPAQAGTLGSYALIGVLVGALTAGAFGDRIGRRKVIVVNLVWFSIGMAVTATTQSLQAFGLSRFLTGVGVGALVATVGALVAEFAPPGQRNRYNAIVYSGIPAGGVLAALLALGFADTIGWRGLFWVGAAPIVALLPVAIAKLPESPKWLVARGRLADAERVSARTGIPVPASEPLAPAKVGFPALATRDLALPTFLLGMMSFAGLLLTYSLNTWLPKIMGDQGYGKDDALAFLLILNLGAIFGGLLASYFADRLGAKRIVASTFVLAAVALALLPLHLPAALLFVAVALAGVGTIGTQVLIYGLVSNYYPTTARAAGVAWCAGFGRLGGIVGPMIGGVLVGAGLGGTTAFYLFAGISLMGALVAGLVPRPPHFDTQAAPAAAAEQFETAPAGATVTA
jgi:MFS transporter, AAHS family, benzoate transport protein